MSFRISGLSPETFRYLFDLSDDELAAHGAKRYVADVKPGYPDRIELRDAEPGERLILVNYTHQPAETPYRASHAVFVSESSEAAYDRVGEVPEALRCRQISLRAFDGDDFLIGADLAPGAEIERAIQSLFADPRVVYIHAHYAKPGCFAARIDRV